MKTLSKLEVLERLDQGWLLSGDVGAGAMFRVINPGQVQIFHDFGIAATIVMELHASGDLAPRPVPGKKMMYRKSPR